MKYEITDIAHEQYPFLHRIRALQDIGSDVKAGDLGGFVENEGNLSFEPDDNAWIFNDAIACNTAYVDCGSVLRDSAVVCRCAYASYGAELTGHARAEDNAYIRGAILSESARASGDSIVRHSPDTHGKPLLSGTCAVYGTVSGDVLIAGITVVFSGEKILNNTPDTLVIQDGRRSIRRPPSREALSPLWKRTSLENPKKKEVYR